MKRFYALTDKLFPFALRLSCFLALILAMLWLAGGGQASASNPIVVNNYGDEKANDGVCTLREAIIAANKDKRSGGKPGECPTGNGNDTIILPAGTYILSRTDSGQEDASQTGDLDITSNVTIVGGPGVTIDASEITDRVFHILEGSVTITGVTIKNGGGNVDQGGGIYNSGTLALTNVTLSGNTADAEGGGIYNTGTLSLTNVTVADNTAVSDGGGVVNHASGTVNLQNTIIASNDPTDCLGTLSSQGYDLVQDTTGCIISDDAITGQDPLLGPLQDNGGGTLTYALLPGSPAIDAGDNVACPITDQRGEVRPLDGDNDGQAQCDIGAFELRRNNFILIRAFLNAEGGTTIQGLLNGTTSTTVNLYIYSSDACTLSDMSPVGDFLTSTQATTDEHGYFTAEVSDQVPAGHVFVNAEAQDLNGNPLGFSNCVSFGSNTSWPFALSLGDVNGTVEIEQYIDKLGQSRWYRFKIEPNSEVVVTLTELEQVAANYDLTIYKDIKEAFLAFLVPEEEDVSLLNAQFAGDAFSGDAFSGDAFSGDAFSGDAFSGDAFSGDAFSGDAFSGDAFSGDAFSGDAFSGDAFSGDAFSGDAFSGDAFSGDAFSAPVFAGDAFSGDAFSGDAFSAAFSSAQIRSLIGVSAFEGTISEGIFVNTWNNTGEFYVRVRGRNGAFSLNAPFHLEVTVFSEICDDVSDDLPDTSHPATSGDYSTIILTDESRMNLDEVVGPPGAEQPLRDWLDDLADSANGVVVNVGEDDRVAAANAQADLNVACPYAKNLVAQAIKDIIDDYRDQNPLEYVVIVGGNEVIPSFHHPDNALLAPESQYSPPVKNNTSSQASLKLDYVLSQDAYGSKFDLSLNNSTYPVPELAVGRLVEAPQEIATVIDAYLNHTDNGVVAPQTSLTTGYDFLYDAAVAIRDELAAGTPGADNDLLTDKAPSDPPDPEEHWTAQDLRDALLPDNGSAPDIAFLAGHFTTNAALAADYVSTMSASEVADSPVDMLNSIFFSAGCHSGYNTIDEHGLNVVDQDGNIIVTKQPDWAQAFASKGATLVAGTGYQYGETDYMEYSERIYLEFSRQLRRSGSVPIGKALMEAKKVYLAQTPQIRGLHEKALLQATIFGLPFLEVDLGGNYSPPTPIQQIPTLSTFDTDPGLTLELQYGDITVESPLNEHTVQLFDIDVPSTTVQASYLSGNPLGDNDGVATYLGEPALPLEIRQVNVSDTTLRGVGWRGGRYQETDVIPVTGAPATEVSGVHTPFLTDYFYPVQMWKVNYWNVLDDPDGITQLMVTPAQHKISSTPSDPQKSTRRQFTETNLRLYYSNHVKDYSTEEGIRSIPGLSGPPVIVRVSAEPDGRIITFNILVTSNPAAGVQEVWIAYTDTGDSCPVGSGMFCTWQSLDLTQNPAESTIWTGELDLDDPDVDIANAADIRFMVQAVNGVGLIGRADNLGKFFVPGVDPVATDLDLLPLPTDNGDFSTKATFSAHLTSDGQDVAGQSVTFRLASAAANKGGLASMSGVALTGPDGIATINLPLRALPGKYEVSAFFAGSATLLPSLDKGGKFTINRRDTVFCLSPDVEEECVLNASMPPDPEADTGIVVVLTDEEGRRLRERTVFFVVEDGSNALSVHTITDWRGRARLGPVNLPVGEYTVNVSFVNGTIVLPTNDPDNPWETVELLDDGYNPTSTAGTLTISAAPVANAGGPYTGYEGAWITLDGTGSYSPSGYELAYEWDLGDGNTGDTPTVDHVYADNGEYIVTLTVTDIWGESDSQTTTVTISNVAPTVDAGDNQIVFLGDPVDLLATFSDPGILDTHTATINWGDGTPVEPGIVNESNGSGTVSGTRIYSEPGEYIVTVTVTDNDGDAGNDTFTVIVISAACDPQTIWPPNSKMVLVKVIVIDPNVAITINGIFQDEPVGTKPDAKIVSNDTAKLRAERDGDGNGRVYHIFFTADDGAGGTYSGEVKAAIVPHDQSDDIDSVDEGPIYDSTQPE